MYLGHDRYKYPLRRVSLTSGRLLISLTVSKRINWDQHMSNISLSSVISTALCKWTPFSVILFRYISYIYFPILKSLLQVFIYRFIRDFANQGKIGHSDLLFLRCVECRFLDIWFATPPRVASTSCLSLARRFFRFVSPCGDTLHHRSGQRISRAMCSVGPCHLLTMLDASPASHWLQNAPRPTTVIAEISNSRA